MTRYLDLNSWTRRETFEYFKNFDKPYFNVSTRVDITQLLARCRSTATNVTLSYHYAGLRAGNEVEPFRYRLRAEGVVIHPVIHGATTVLLPNESFSFARFNYEPDFQQFLTGASRAVADVLAGGVNFKPRDEVDAVIHFTTLPWISFTSFSHARNWRRRDSVPKIAFGKFMKEGDRVYLPVSVEVHHALMDGLHVGRYLEEFQRLLLNAEPG
ncbi:MAG: CatA-like O-acetyltransferase [Pyrinomonadaceae bacterium]